MKTETPQTIYLKDYQAPEFLIPEIHLDFQLFDEYTLVRNRMRVCRNPKSGVATGFLKLNGETGEDALELVSVAIDGTPLSPSEFQNSSLDLTIAFAQKSAEGAWVEITTKLQPKKNLAYSGLYQTGKMFCTQCEAEGFRRITYFLDRPDVMSAYTVRLEADFKKYPVLLSNGNPGKKAILPSQGSESVRHEAWWHDPFPKPAYLFALVAGDLAKIEGTFKTMSGRQVALEVYCADGHQDRCTHALWSLQEAMRWDEQAFGREYDLDIYMIVAADDFNAGAMENKGLNIFNSKYVLAKTETATDSEFDGILSVVGHEYFHNWTGNRITCRDWFQLSLKEGLTVFRDQEFSSDLGSRGVKRIEDVIRLRTMQFMEDSGPMSHPVRPSSYIEINNFYTVTVYEKGAEVIRMIHTLLGAKKFRLGMDHYFAQHDGQAVTTEDFVAAFETANKIDLTQFKNWYDQAGTPTLHISSQFDDKTKTLDLHVRQELPKLATKPYHLPLSLGLLGKAGVDLNFNVMDAAAHVAAESVTTGKTDHTSSKTSVLHVRKIEHTFHLTGVTEKPVLSLLRGFSAPVNLKYEYADDELAFLMAHDSDSFNRWQAGQTLMTREILRLYDGAVNAAQESPVISSLLISSFAKVVRDGRLENSFKAKMLTLPNLRTLSQAIPLLKIDVLFKVWKDVQENLVADVQTDLTALYETLKKVNGPAGQPKASGERELKNTCLSLLCCDPQNQSARKLALTQLEAASNMSDEMGALGALNLFDSEERTKAVQLFYNKWQHESLVMNAWFKIQASLPSETTLSTVKALAADPAFDVNNPNKVYSLFAQFGLQNLVGFHRADGQSYRYLADMILDVDSRNPQVASRLMQSFTQWKTYDVARQELMHKEIKRITEFSGLSKNVFEVASRSL